MLEFDKSQAVEAISDTVAGTDRIPRGYMGKDWIPDGMVYKDNGKIPNNLIPSRVVRDPITADMLEESFLTQLKQEFTGQRG